ncbi:ATPase [Bacillus hominis]|uniref:ATPase n=1 Tax=Bacillus hominis TaxID=2817478 RepID=A0ABT7RE77_9BACI|nr:ATPase [Bacillus hominis]MDM5196134.1 ATPase [Bacillus hominis]MDM5435794.1 ATPase [Bacillus hominis]MDM5441242.1 ATPase [Bacillus hominis]
MNKQGVMRFLGSLFLAGILLNTSLVILNISWGTILISNVALIILYAVSEYREKRRLKEEGVPALDERVMKKMQQYFMVCMVGFFLLFTSYLCVNKYLDREIVDVNESLYIVIFGLLISVASTSVLATRDIK